jgi:hypothetical protein
MFHSPMKAGRERPGGAEDGAAWDGEKNRDERLVAGRQKPKTAPQISADGPEIAGNN